MTSIIKIIDTIDTFRIGDYVQFHNEKVGYVKNIVNTDTVRIMEASETTRKRYYTVYKHLCKVIPLAGNDPKKHRSIIQ